MAKRDEEPSPRDQLTGSELVHPIYLDVPMMVSFLAAVEGGVSFEGESKTIEGAQTAKEREASGGFRLPGLGSLLSLDASGRLKNADTGTTSSEVTTVRRHTEASLFNLLRARLEADDAVTRLADGSALGELKAGDLVEVTGEVRGNPLQEVLNLFGRLAPYLGIDLDKPRGKRSDGSKQKQRGNQPSRQQRQQQQQQSDEASVMGEEELRLLMTMRADLDQASVRDLVLAGPDDIKAVLTLSREFLHVASEEYLLDGRFRVLGKVTRVLAGDDYINLTRRTALGLMGPELIREMMSFMDDDPTMAFEMSDPVVEVPGLQLLPLAIFA
jgi:hypothetical protein